MKEYEILEHESDIKIRVFGKNKKELFKNAMLAMQNSLRPEILSYKTETRRIKIKSDNLPLLLVDFLSEVNYLNETKKEVYSDVKFIKFSNSEIDAEISGKKISEFGLQIKGVTYHELDIHRRRDGIWTAVILFDI